MPNLDLTYLFGLAPEKAIEYLTSKGYAITWDWHEMLDAAHAKAFTVAKVMKVDILDDIQAELQKGLDDGISFAEFKKNLIPRLKAKGWWGEIVNEATGEVANVGPWRLRTIFDANVQTAYMVGHYQQAIQNTADRPWWMYVAVMDKRTRPAHAALNGLVFRYDDPFWDSHFPPNGFRCRCSVRFLDDEGMKGRPGALRSTKGPDANARLDQVEKPLDKAGMKTTQVTAVKTKGLDGRTVAMAPDAGWNYNPGKAGARNLDELLERKVKNLPPQLAEQVRKDTPQPRGLAQRHDVKDYASLGGLMKEYAGQNPEAFCNGYRSIEETDGPYFMATRPIFGEFLVSKRTFVKSGNFEPSKNLLGALQNIRHGKELTFNEEYALESLWHEINHNRAKGFWPLKNQSANRCMETLNQFVSRHTYPEFMQSLGGTARHQADVLAKGYGYNTWVENFRALLEVVGLDEKAHLPEFEKILFEQSHSKLKDNLAKYISKASGKKKKEIAWCLDKLNTLGYKAGVKVLFNPIPDSP
jgi:SPP1 gp7 family putative phage head morphogenesis protein